MSKPNRLDCTRHTLHRYGLRAQGLYHYVTDSYIGIGMKAMIKDRYIRAHKMAIKLIEG